MIRRVTNYINGVKLEMKKVTWLSKKELLGSTVIVGVFTILIAVFLFIADFSIGELITRLYGGK
mgnify:FL=1